MLRIFSFAIIWISLTPVVYPQGRFRGYIKDAFSGEPLPGASARVKGTESVCAADKNGMIILENIPPGDQVLIFSFIGYNSKTLKVRLWADSVITREIFLIPGQQLEEVVINSTRTSSTLDDTPTRIELLASDELNENAVMNSANVAMLLRESTGIMAQQTSANSGNQSIRIQGLDGRYTQILRDGFPIYAGFASGLGIMQIPPLDLQQVEVIKGSSSTLYGGGAIAGLVNLITKSPQEGKTELNLMANQTSALGTNVNSYYSERFKKMGITLYASGNLQKPYDSNKDNFSDLPGVKSIAVNPKIYFYPGKNTVLWLGINSSFENRTGGDMTAIKNPSQDHPFSEENLSSRQSAMFSLDHQSPDKKRVMLKSAVNYFNRKILLPSYVFHGKQLSTFSEFSWSLDKEKSKWIIGANLVTDNFYEPETQNPVLRDYRDITAGIFAQNTYSFSRSVAMESGLRIDYNTDFGIFPLPRISLLYRKGKNFSARLGGGLGYKTPTIFTELTEERAYRNLMPVDRDKIIPERSTGGNFDFNYRTAIGEHFSLSVNQLFFITDLRNYLVLKDSTGIPSFFYNSAYPVSSKGLETNLKFNWDDFGLYFQYSLVDTRVQAQEGYHQKPLTPRHSLGTVLMYEKPGVIKIGYELYYISSQLRSDLSKTPTLWIMGIMAIRDFRRFSIFLNFENFTDTRQSKFETTVFPPVTNPVFAEIWAPTDGFVANGGFIFHIL
jgi:outer membrane receptor for ferrienterochelin and colicins